MKNPPHTYKNSCGRFHETVPLNNCAMCREENGQEITMVFDCRNAGLKNLDMEFVQFIIGNPAIFSLL